MNKKILILKMLQKIQIISMKKLKNLLGLNTLLNNNVQIPISLIQKQVFTLKCQFMLQDTMKAPTKHLLIFKNVNLLGKY